jgi:hypothetical protein
MNAIEAAISDRKLAPMPSPADIMAARGVLKSYKQAQLRLRRALKRAEQPIAPHKGNRGVVYPTATYLCGYCGLPFVARVVNRPVMARWCGHSCRELAYQHRRRVAAKREATRAAVLAEMGMA